MKAKIFYDVESFNRWAKGKALTKDVIIHTVAWQRESVSDSGFAIIVYHPEDPFWDKTGSEPEKTTTDKPAATNDPLAEIRAI